MPDYRRAWVPGATFLFTAVTYRRRDIFSNPRAVDLLRIAFRECRSFRPFVVDAIVVLPDHLHTIWSLPPGDADFSTRWRHLKRTFTTLYASRIEPVGKIQGRGDRRLAVWQPRFWERVVRDEDELEALADYIHYNPVKHGLAASPSDWEASSFRSWVERGNYPLDWGASVEPVRNRLTIAERLAGEPPD